MSNLYFYNATIMSELGEIVRMVYGTVSASPVGDPLDNLLEAVMKKEKVAKKQITINSLSKL